MVLDIADCFFHNGKVSVKRGQLQCLVMRSIEAETIEEAHSLAVERTFKLARRLEKVEPRASFGPVDDQYEPIHQVKVH